MNKEYILKEIHRTADINGGIPLGEKRFLSETGMKLSDWKGRFWARWGDALREAGYSPNQLTTAFDRKLFIEKYALLAQELGRLPTANDIKLKHHNDTKYPNISAFFNRFETMEKIIKEVGEFYKTNELYKNVVQMCEEYVPRKRSKAIEMENIKEEIGFVYLIKSGKFYKIGRSNSIGRREYELSIQLPEKALIVHEIKTDDPVGIESYWHKRFDLKRKNGEWFELEPSDISAFKRRKFM